MIDTLLHTTNLAVGYSSKSLLSNLNLSLVGGEMICLLGPNGVGKSTLIKSLIGAIPPVDGTVFIEGKSITEIPFKRVAKSVSVVLTKKITNGEIKVFDLVAMGRIPYTNIFGYLTSKDKIKIEKAMEAVGVSRFANSFINNLSDGERQRVLIAKALAQDTPIIILDEPTAHLDIENRLGLLTLLKNLARETKKAILLSTHELELAMKTADKLWLISNKGELEVGTTEDLILQGVLSKVFNKGKIHFDINTGTFNIHHETCSSIRLFGEGYWYYWTKLALEKIGYEVMSYEENEELPLVRVTPDNWTFEFKEKVNSFKSVELLIYHLKKGIE